MIAFVYAENGPGLFGTLGDAVDRERDVLGRELAAVGELDALAELELPRRRVDRLPRRREAGDHLRVGVHLDELVEDVLGNVVVREEVEEVRVDRRDVGGDRDLELGRDRGGSASAAMSAAVERPRYGVAIERIGRSSARGKISGGGAQTTLTRRSGRPSMCASMMSPLTTGPTFSGVPL